MRNPKRLLILGLSLSLWLSLSSPLKASTSQPNIIIVLVDDMGYSDLGCTGSEIDTPHLDALARNGALFTHCYNTSRCCPSRAALLTGQYQWDAGIGHMISSRSKLPEYSAYLSEKTPIIPELLREEGYQTFMTGKWHLGDDRERWPDKRGFEQFYGTPNGGGLYFYPSKFYKRPIYHNGELVTPDENWYSTDGFTDAAIEMIEERETDRPFFLYLAYIAPHFPLQARDEDIAKYQGRYDAGYDAIRDARFAKQKELGIVSTDQSLPKPTYLKWETIKDPETESLKMEVYAAQVDRIDQNIGRLISTLQEQEIAENTVFMFLSDNGATSESFNRTPNAKIGTRDSNAAYGNWYQVSNTPYRFGKKQEHEGGIITPLVVHWPAGIADPGMTISEPLHLMDIMPACLDLGETTYPIEQVSDPFDGQSFLPLLKGQPQDPQRIFHWEHQGNRAIRHGNWKLVALHKKPWELYNLADDPYEQRNLAKAQPEKAEILTKRYQEWADKHGVQPWPLRK